MARKKRTTKRKSSHRRKRSVGGINDMDVMQIALIAGGAVLSRIMVNKLTTSTNTTMQKIAPYSGLLAGLVLPMVTKNDMIKGISLGLVGGGAVSALGPTGLKVISGFENTIAGRVGYPPNIIPYRQINGIMDDGRYVSKPNFSGSGKSQMNVISGIAHMAGGGCGSGDC
jgi:hypothetical protein